jgi:two-component system, LytTR family, sensor kinase
MRQRVQPWMLVSAGWILPAILGAINEWMQRRLGGSPPPTVPELLFASGDWLIYAFLTPMVFAVAARWPLAKPHLTAHLLGHLAISLLFCVAWAGLGAALRAALVPEALQGGFAMHFASWLFITLPFGVAVYFAVVGLAHAIRYFTEARDREVQNAHLSEQLSTAQLAALQAQLNPHFLFNALNTIAVLVRDGERTGAARLIEHLSEVLRSTLRQRRGPEVALEEELDVVRQYLAIEQARFSDRLQATIDVDAAVSFAAVPVLAVQHLVENAIRHGIARSPDAKAVAVVARRDGDALTVTVTDDGGGIDPAAATLAEHGIANTRVRLRALYGDRASLVVRRGETGGTIATLQVPYREIAREVSLDDA